MLVYDEATSGEMKRNESFTNSWVSSKKKKKNEEKKVTGVICFFSAPPHPNLSNRF